MRKMGMGKLPGKDSGKFDKLRGGGGGSGKIDNRASYSASLLQGV